MLNATIARMSLLCALASLGTACAEEPPLADMPREALLPMSVAETAAAEPPGSAPAVTAKSSAPASAHIFPRQANVHGKSYEEWAAAWWQWVLSVPADVNPTLDGPCDVNQPDHVFFLGGNFGGAVTRSCTVPKGKKIFFPILNALAINCPELAGGSYTCEMATSEEYIHDATASLLDIDNTLSLEIDGVAVEGLDEYRAHTDTFSAPEPEDGGDRMMTCSGPIRENPCGVPVGSPRNGASDGHWVMLRPLSPGAHQIRFTGSVPSLGFSLDITYDIVVAN